MKLNNIEDKIIEMLMTRESGKSICPSEVARDLYPSSWRGEMSIVRRVAWSMVEEGIIEVTQKGKVVDHSAKGAIRLRLKK